MDQGCSLGRQTKITTPGFLVCPLREYENKHSRRTGSSVWNNLFTILVICIRYVYERVCGMRKLIKILKKLFTLPEQTNRVPYGPYQGLESGRDAIEKRK